MSGAMTALSHFGMRTRHAFQAALCARANAFFFWRFDMRSKFLGSFMTTLC